MLRELDSGEERELDILLEGGLGPHPLRIAIECRDHARKPGKPWIESLKAKYAHLPVDQVIAVSRSGFTSTAYGRARLANIRLLSIEQALGEDWVKRVSGYRAGFVTWHHALKGGTVIYAGPGPSGLSGPELLSAPITAPDGSEASTVEADLESLYRKHANEVVREWAAIHMKEAWAKGPGKEWEVRVPFVATNRFLHDPEAVLWELERVELVLTLRYELSTAEPRYYTYGDARIATTVVDHPGRPSSFTFTILFDENHQPKALNVSAEEKKT
jgi:hypothetical protein